jgi:hypothetical protein
MTTIRSAARTALPTALFAAAALMLPSAWSQDRIGKVDFEAGKTRIEADYKADRSACSQLAGNGRDICVEQAKAREKVGHAELEYRYSGKPADANRVLVVRAESDYAVAREKCDDRAGNEKDVCIREAKAVEVKALTDARVIRQVEDARSDAADDVRNADYRVATEKCDALAGDAKTGCLEAARSRFHKL